MIRDDTDAFGGYGMTSSDDPFATPDVPDGADTADAADAANAALLGRFARARRRLGAVATLFTRRP